MHTPHTSCTFGCVCAVFAMCILSSSNFPSKNQKKVVQTVFYWHTCICFGTGMFYLLHMLGIGSIRQTYVAHPQQTLHTFSSKQKKIKQNKSILFAFLILCSLRTLIQSIRSVDRVRFHLRSVRFQHNAYVCSLFYQHGRCRDMHDYKPFWVKSCIFLRFLGWDKTKQTYPNKRQVTFTHV